MAKVLIVLVILLTGTGMAAAQTATPTPTFTPTHTSTPTDTPTPTPSPTPTNTPTPTHTPTPELSVLMTVQPSGGSGQDVVLVYTITLDEAASALLLFVIVCLLWAVFVIFRLRGWI